MSGRRSLLWAGTLVLAGAVAALPQGRPISGAAPIGAAGHAVIGATGSLVHTGAGFGRRYGTGGSYRGGYSGDHRGGYGYNGNGGYRRGGAVFVTPFFYGGPGFDPAYDYGPGPYAADAGPEPPPADPDTQNLMMQQNAMGQAIDELSDKVDAMQQQARAEGPQYGPGPVAATQNPNPPTPPVTVVLQNGQSFQSADYAVMNGTFWDFTKQPARRVPMSTIDIAASEKASQASGAEFPEVDQ